MRSVFYSCPWHLNVYDYGYQMKGITLLFLTQHPDPFKLENHESTMVKIKNNGKHTNFRSINGHSLNLYINSEPISLKVVVLNSTKALHKEFIVLILLVSLQTLFLTIEAGSFYVVIVIFFICLFSYRIFIYAIEENLVIIKGLGIHIETKYIIGSKAVFIPHEKVQNVFINEVILRNKIVFILTLLIRNEEDKENLVPLFVETLPRLGMLTVVYNFMREFIQKG